MARLHDERGFSLLELLIVLAIIACLAVVAAPVYASQRSKAEDVLLVANARNLTTSVQSGWMTCRTPPRPRCRGRSSWRGSGSPSSSETARDRAGLHFVNPCTDSDAVVNTNKLPTGRTAPAVWITSDPASRSRRS